MLAGTVRLDGGRGAWLLWIVTMWLVLLGWLHSVPTEAKTRVRKRMGISGEEEGACSYLAMEFLSKEGISTAFAADGRHATKEGRNFVCLSRICIASG